MSAARRSAIQLPVLPAAATSRSLRVALAGNPNAGKTTLFNKLTGLRAKTANFSGTTTSTRVGRFDLGGRSVELLDLPGLYGLSEHKIEERIARDALLGAIDGQGRPDAAIVVLDATNIARNLYLAGQVRELGVPTVIALNMIDLAEKDGLVIDTEALAIELGAPVVSVSARSGRGVADLMRELESVVEAGPAGLLPLPSGIAACGSCSGCPHEARYDWAEGVGDRTVGRTPGARVLSATRTEALDGVLTHPAWGLVLFALIMTCLFVSVFSVAQFPMTWIESGFAIAGNAVGGLLPPGDLRSFVVDGVIGGVGGVLVFLPQILVLFFIITLLEDTGYLARAAFVVDRPMSKVGLPGRAFVPMLSAHACAVPAIMSTRVIENQRDRLAAILVIPLLTCTARLPVYVMITALLFAGRPILGGIVFSGAYLMGMVAALVMAFVFKRTILRGASRALVIELPRYKLPSVRNAALTALERGRSFVRKAGTTILAISMVLWVAATYPKLDYDDALAAAEPTVAAQVAAIERTAGAALARGDDRAFAEGMSEAEMLLAPTRLEHSTAGRIGRAAEPLFRPLGFDWKINVGVLSSFAAREVIVSTMAILYGIGEDGAEDKQTLTGALAAQTHDDGSPVFTMAASLALLVFYVLAMQCLPTQIVTRRETGTWKWPLFQLGYMTALAWVGAFLTYQLVSIL